MTWSFPIGRLLGSELRIHATFFLLILWIAVSAWLAGGPAAAIVNIAFVLALFACVVAHEYGHALMARRYGIATPDITLLPIGGLARLERMPEDPRQEIAVALAGPAVNVAIWLVLAVILGARTDLESLVNVNDPGAGFAARLAAVNLFLALFNLIPAFPMDGGRVLRAVLSLSFGRVTATRYAARAGQAIAFLLGLWGLTAGSPILLLIAIFVFVAAGAEQSDVATRDMAADVPARDAMITQYEALTPGDTMATAAASLIRTTQHEFPVVDPASGQLRGMVTRVAIFKAAEDGQRAMAVEDAMDQVPTIALDAPFQDALDALAQPGVPAVAISDRTGAFLGYITRENVGEWMVVRRRQP
ncbi:MAG: site-2 protease family protein [Pseudomonadota bacterium]